MSDTAPTDDAPPADTETAVAVASGPFRAPGQFPTASDAQRIAGTTVEYGWYAPIDRTMVPIAPMAAWEDSDLSPASRAALHAWEPIDAILSAHSFAPEAAPLDTAVAYAESWLDLGLAPSEPDLGVAGRRALRLGYLAEATRHDRLVAAATALCDDLLEHIDPADPSLESADALTGVVTLAARAVATGNAAATDSLERGRRAIGRYLDAAFTVDGIHRTQTPGIQRSVIDRLTMLLDAGHVTDATVAEARTRAEQSLAWFITPDGTAANFGATGAEPISSAYDPSPSEVRFLPERITDPAYLLVASAGRFGRPPEMNRRIFHQGGYLVIKEPWPARADDAPPASHLVVRTGPPVGGPGLDIGLAMTWHDGGRSLLIEPGPVASGTTHPAAVALTRPDAHNRVVVGSAPTEPGPDDGSAPVRSTPLSGGLQRWGLMEGHYFCDSYEESGAGRHRRSIMFEPGAWLLVADVIDIDGGRPTGPRFHLAPTLDVLAVGDRFTLVERTEPVGWAVSLAEHRAITARRGELEPTPSGWWSPDGHRMVPNWTLGWEHDGPATFVTLLAIDERPAVDQSQGAWFGWHTGTYQARVAVTEWGIVDIDIQHTSEEDA